MCILIEYQGSMKRNEKGEMFFTNVWRVVFLWIDASSGIGGTLTI